MAPTGNDELRLADTPTAAVLAAAGIEPLRYEPDGSGRILIVFRDDTTTGAVYLDFLAGRLTIDAKKMVDAFRLIGANVKMAKAGRNGR